MVFCNIIANPVPSQVGIGRKKIKIKVNFLHLVTSLDYFSNIIGIPRFVKVSLMDKMPKLLIILGILFIFAGLFYQFGGKYFPLGKLPGDIIIKKGNSTFYFPLTTCILISAILSLILGILKK